MVQFDSYKGNKTSNNMKYKEENREEINQMFGENFVG